MVKKLPANAGDTEDAALIPGLGRSPGEGNSNPLQYSGLENPMTEEPGRLQSMESHRVRHHSASNSFTFTFKRCADQEHCAYDEAPFIDLRL